MGIVTPANQWTVGIAKQPSGELVIPTVAAYEHPVYSGTPVPVQSVNRVEVTDSASIVADPYKQSGEHWEAQIEMPAFANSLGTYLSSMYPTDTIGGTGTASQKTLTNATQSAGTVTFTAASHGYSNSDYVLVVGMTPATYNGLHLISNVAANTFDVTGFDTTLTSPATVFGTATKVPYWHVFSGLGGTQNWYTMYSTAPGSMLQTFEAGIATGIGFSFDENGGPVRVQSKFIGKKPTKTAHTITTSNALSDGFFTVTGGTLKVEEDSSTPAAATNIQKAAVVVDRPGSALPTADGVTVAYLAQGKVDPSFTATILYADWQAYQASYYGSVSGTSPSSTIVKGSFEVLALHTIQTSWALKIRVPSAVWLATPPVPDPSGGPLTVSITGYATKPTSGDHVQVVLANGVTPAY